VAYVVETAVLHYAVIYEGVIPDRCRERRRWHRSLDRAEGTAPSTTKGPGR
jgi:hypothetical protein